MSNSICRLCGLITMTTGGCINQHCPGNYIAPKAPSDCGSCQKKIKAETEERVTNKILKLMKKYYELPENLIREIRVK